MSNLIYDIQTQSNTTSLTIDLFATPIEKGEIYEFTYSNLTATSTQTFMNLGINGQTTFRVQSSEIGQTTQTTSNSQSNFYSYIIAASSGSRGNIGTSYIRVTNDNRVIIMQREHWARDVAGATGKFLPILRTMVSEFSVSSVTSINLTFTSTGQLSAGARFSLRKIATLQEEVVVSSAQTEILFDNLNVQKNNEYLLLSEFYASNNYASIFINGNNDGNNYSRQYKEMYSTTIGGSRGNDSRAIRAINTGFNMTFIKLANNGYFFYRTNSALRYTESSQLFIADFVGSSKFSSNNISQILISSDSNAILANSRFELYKLI